jgi:hypothetical protein
MTGLLLLLALTTAQADTSEKTLASFECVPPEVFEKADKDGTIHKMTRQKYALRVAPGFPGYVQPNVEKDDTPAKLDAQILTCDNNNQPVAKKLFEIVTFQRKDDHPEPRPGQDLDEYLKANAEDVTSQRVRDTVVDGVSHVHRLPLESADGHPLYHLFKVDWDNAGSIKYINLLIRIRERDKTQRPVSPN